MSLDANKILKREVRRIRHAYDAMGEGLEALEKELQKIQAPAPERKRRDLKTGRIEKYDRMYASGKWMRKN